MNVMNILAEWLQQALDKVLGSDVTVFQLASKTEVQGAYAAFGGMEVRWERTKDGSYPVSVSASVSIVDESLTTVDMLADAVEAMLLDSTVTQLGDVCVDSRRSDYDAATGEYIEEIKLTIYL